MKVMVCAAVLIAVLTASQGLASDICSLGKETLLLPDAGREKFYKNKIEGRILEGKGSVVNAWQRGPGKNYTVSIDCGNDVVINVTTSADAKNLKVGQQVDFKGTCVSYGSRRYIYSKKTYMVFGMERGSVGKISNKPE
jgi:hypothetical protein